VALCLIHLPSSICILKEFKSAEGGLTELKFGAFNFPEKGENLLAKIDFTPQQLFSAAKPMEEVFWLPIEPNFFNIATTLQVHSMVFPHSVFIAYAC
jgi:hypothetical protein